VRQVEKAPKTFHEVKATTFHEVKATTFHEVKACRPQIDPGNKGLTFHQKKVAKSQKKVD